MATTNNVVVENFAPTSSTLNFNQIWKLTRAMKKAGWKYKAGSDGTTKNTSSDPAADPWGGGVVTNAGAGAASIAAPTLGRATITGLTGIVAGDKGRFLRITGAATGANNNQHQIEEIISATSVRIDARNFAVASDANNGSLTWDIRDPLSDVYPGAFGAAAVWICMQGPSTLKIPITGASTGTFLKGENVVQTTTGAEGEIIGYIFESGAGYLVVSPRLRGTGTGVFGWQTGNVITGDSSTATVTHNGTAVEYRHETVFWKNASEAVGGTRFDGTFDPVAQSAELFSTLATSAGCTATVPPGAGGTGNTIGTHGVATYCGATITTGLVWTTGAGTAHGNAQIICVDCIEEQNYTADGSWTWAGCNLTLNGGEHCVHGFERLDDTENGDVDPYVTLCPGTNEAVVTNNRVIGSTSSLVSDTTSSLGLFQPGVSQTYMKGWRRLGLSGEQLINLVAAILTTRQGSLSLSIANPTTPLRIASSSSPTQKVREPIWVVSGQLTHKIIKGTFRWIYIVQGGNGTDVYDNVWLQVSPGVPAGIIGPWNGATVYVS